MPKYLFEASYNTDGVKGMMKDGGSGRKAALEAAAEGLGGSVEAFYFAFGDTDVYVIAEFPDNATASAMATAVAASGKLSKIETVVLLTPEEVDSMVKKTVAYRAPGG